MDLKIALKAIDYFIPRSNEEAFPTVVSYYGGEPLLNFSLIKETHSHIKKKYKDKKILMHITTNGTLINKEIARFLIENEFLLSISLDGPKEINDRYRVFSNGKGSFDIIKKNLLMIKEYDEKYYDSKVHYQPVLAPPYCYRDVFGFFLNDELFSSRTHIKAGYANLTDSNIELQEYCEERELENRHYIIQQNYNYLFSKPKPNENNLFFNLFLKEILKIATRGQGFIEHTKDYFHVPGICLPGKKKFFVSCDGNFHMCEKVEPSMPIGNIEKGLDFERIKSILDSYCHTSEKNCCDCWAIRLCGICFSKAIKNGKFDLEFKKMNCEREKSRILKNLIIYMKLLEKNPNALEDFKYTKWID